MNIHRALLALPLLAAGIAAAGPLLCATPPVGPGSIVGLWDTHITAGPCPGGPAIFNGRGLNVFHAGGTMSAANNLPPAGNGPTYGVWRYGGSGHYTVHMQFYRFRSDGSFDGIQDIHRDMLISADGQRTEETTFVRVLNPDDTLRATLCGVASARRVR